MSQELFQISDTQPLKDYQSHIETHIQCNEITDDAVIKENFTKIAQAVRDAIWRLLFSNIENKTSNDDSQRKAAELLEEYKGDACFYDPWPYNDWIIKLRDEVLSHGLLDFWCNIIVKKQLGPCWSRESDLFDGDDAPPIEFYAHAGCVAPFATSLTVRAASAPSDCSTDITNTVSIDDVSATTGNFEAKISKTQPLADYRDLMKRFVLVNVIVPDDVHKESVNKIATAIRDVIWSLLFEGAPTPQDFETAIELLQEYKSDACFYGPWEYNQWIVKLRDEILKRGLIEIWREKIVQLELGPCCARDSDFFDASDELPTKFYEEAGCKAPFDG